MWKVLLAFLSHRLVLFLVALLVINSSFNSGSGPLIHPFSQLLGQFHTRVAEGSEAVALRELMQAPMGRVFAATYNPLLWIARWTCGLLRLSPVTALLLLSNFFCILFLWQLNSLFNRMVTPDVAASATILVILWPTSYELSLGSTLVVSCFLVALLLHHALENQWFVAGIALGLLAIYEPLAAGLMPLALYIFWYFQRHFPLSDVCKRALFFLVPFALAVFWRWTLYEHLSTVLFSSAGNHLLGIVQGRGVGWLFSHEMAGQTIAVLFFLIGAIAALFSNITFVHRVIPVTMLLLTLLFSPYAALASRVPLAGICMEGIASASSRLAGRVVAVLMLSLGIYEMVAIFR